VDDTSGHPPDLENRDTGLDVEASRSGCAGIHDETGRGLCDERSMGMAVDNDVGRITSEQPLRLGRSQLVTVAHVDAEAVHDKVDGGAQPRVRLVIGVAVDRLHRRNDRELVENLVAVDVARVKDERDSRQGLMNLGPHQPMCIRDEADAAKGGCEMWDVG
jgi:hypothetical protein